MWCSSANSLLFRPDIPRVGTDRAGVMRCRRSLLAAVGCCCCCHRCCQPLVLVPISAVCPALRQRPPCPGPGHHYGVCAGAETAPVPCSDLPPNPTAAAPDDGRVLSRVGVADHAVTLKAPWTGSGWREYSYGGFGGGHPRFHPHTRNAQPATRFCIVRSPGAVALGGRRGRGGPSKVREAPGDFCVAISSARTSERSDDDRGIPG